MTQRILIFLLVSVSTILACGTCPSGTTYAQKNLSAAQPTVFVDSHYISVNNGSVQVWLDKASGQFWAARAYGGQILFSNEGGPTSATSVYLNGATFTNNRLRAPQPPAGTLSMPDGIGTIVDDTLVFIATMQHERASAKLTQKFVPILEGDYGFVRIITTVTNTSQKNVDIGLQNLFDLYLLDTDVLTVWIDDVEVSTESQWSGASVPERYEATAAHVPWKIIARLSGNGTTPPDILTVGNWRYDGYIGAPAWDYTPSGLPLTVDNATLLQWNKQPLPPGASRTVVTDYGVEIQIRSSLSCIADVLRLNFTEDGYDPDPFRVIAHITNTGELDIRDMQIRIVLPPDIHLGAGETLARTVVGPLGKGQSIPVSWNLHADTSGSARTAMILVILDDGTTIDTCETEVAIPAIPHYELQTHCPEDVYLELTDDRLSYKNAAFTIETRVRNIGNVSLNSISALMQPPAILQLAGGTALQFLEPDEILPGLESAVSWQLRATPQCKDTTVELRITLQRMPFYEDTCVLRVHFPATRTTACIPNGIFTRGTSFHSSLLYNNALDDSLRPQAVLYIMSDSTSHITVTEEMTGYRYEFTVNSCDAQTVVLSDSANSLLLPVFESIERRSVTITATYPVTVIAGSLRLLHSDATLLLPDHALGREYISLGYNYGSGGETEHFSIVAAHDNTQIDYRLWVRSSGSIPGRTPQQLALNTSETFAIHQGLGGPAGGLTGSTLTATRPIGLVSGMSGGHIPGWGLDLLYKNPVLHQVPPIEHFGKEYVVAPFRSRKRGYTIRVVASEPGTNIVVGSQPHTLTNKGDRFETQLLDPTRIAADKPILVAQFAHSSSYDDSLNEYGDGSMVILPPVERFASCHTFPTALGSNIKSAGQRFPITYANLVVHAGGESQVSVNGIPVPDSAFHPLPGTIYLTATVEFPPGVQNIGTTDMRGVGVMVYAFEHHDAFSFTPGYVSGPLTTGVADAPIPDGLTLEAYPNPASDRLVATVHSAAPLPGSLIVYDALGRERTLVHRGAFQPGQTQFGINVQSYPPGIYYLVLQRQDARHSLRFTVMR